MAFVVTAAWRAKPGEGHRIVAILNTMAPLSRAESGCLIYQAHVSPRDPDDFFLYEQYTDEQAYENHKASAHFQEHVLGDAIDHLEDRSVITYETIDI